METILQKNINTNYECTKWKDNSTYSTPGQLKCEKYIQTQTQTRVQNQDYIDAEIIRINYVDHFITLGILLLFFILIVRKFLFK